MPARQPVPVGERFGRLTILEDLGSPNRRRRVLVACDCGTRKEADWPHIKYGCIRTCGCIRPEVLDARNRTHGASYSRTYSIWRGMLQRSVNINRVRAESMGYGHVSVCDRWRSFEAFLADMGEAPLGRSLDRIDGSRGYEPGNCRWATNQQQRENSTYVRMVTFNGETRTIAGWARHLKIAPSTLYTRLNRGWPVERALTVPESIARGLGPTCAGGS